MIDSHCHLDGARYDADRDEVLERAAEAGIELMMAIGTGDGPPDLEAGVRLAEKYPQFVASAGVHPHDASKAEGDTYKHLEALARHPKVVAIGEIGLDYHYDFSPRDVQKEAFERQMAIAAGAGKPIVIHTREAWDDTFAMLEREWAPRGLPAVLHCFTGGPEEARRALAMGCYLAFGGVVTYPKSVEVHEAAKMTPIEKMLLETDAPYLAPAPHRGKRNEPAYLVWTAKKIAELRGETVEAIAAATAANFRRLAGLDATGPGGGC